MVSVLSVKDKGLRSKRMTTVKNTTTVNCALCNSFSEFFWDFFHKLSLNYLPHPILRVGGDIVSLLDPPRGGGVYSVNNSRKKSQEIPKLISVTRGVKNS